jgi:hypothetical protein
MFPSDFAVSLPRGSLAMRRNDVGRLAVFAAIFLVLLCSGSSRAQDPAAAKGGKPSAEANPLEGATPGNSGLQREYARLAQALNSDDHFGKSEAAETLLKVRPSDVANTDTRKLIARGYKTMAEEGRGFDQEKAIRGLVVWGGKYSVPIIIEMMEKEGRHPSEEYFNALAQLKDPRGAAAIARFLGDFFSHDEAVAALRRMGPAAEDALIAAAPSNNADASVAAVLLLGDIGGDKSVAILTKATGARNQQVKQAARDAIKKIRQRQKTGEVPDAGKEEDPDSPFAGAGPAVDIRANGGDESADLNVNEGDWSAVKALLPGEPAGAGVTADPDRVILDPKWKPSPMRLGKSNSQRDQPTAVSVAGGNSPVAVVLHSDSRSRSIARLEHLELKKRDSSKSSSIVGGAKSMKLSPGATRLLMVSEDASQKDASRLDVFKFNKGVAAEEITWWPFATSREYGEGEIGWFDWVDEDQLLTVNGKGTLVLWRLEGKNAKAVYQLDVGGSAMPALSPGRAQLAIATGGGAEIYRITDGELLARFGEDSTRGGPMLRLRGYFWGGGSVAFNRAGNRLAHVANGDVSVWNTTNGKLERDFYCNHLNGSGIEWLDDGHLLVGGMDIVDLDRRLIAWRYVNPLLASTSWGGWRWLVLNSGNAVGIAPVKMLQPEVLDAANELDADEVLALKPGAKVTLEIQLGGEEQAKAEAALKASLEKNGMEVVPDSPIRISAQIVTGNSETKEYGRGFFNREQTEQVTTTEKRYEVEVKVDGESIWKHSSTMQSAGGPGLVSLKEGETAQQVIDRENAERAARFGFGVELPRYVVHPKYAGPLGTSQISLGGR